MSTIMSLGKEEFCDLALKCRLDFCLPDATSSQTHTQVDRHRLARRGKALTIRRTLLRKLCWSQNTLSSTYTAFFKHKTEQE